MRLLRLAMAVTAVALVAAPASAQEYPTRPINLIVAFPAGGSTDIGARVLAGIAEKMIGQPIVVVNRGGAGGQVGWTELARAKPDGYTIGFLNLPATNTTILDPERQAIFNEGSFTPIANQVLDPGVRAGLAEGQQQLPLAVGGQLLEQGRVVDGHGQGPAADLPQPGPAPVRLPDGGVPGGLQLQHRVQPAVAAQGEQLAEHVGQGPGAALVGVGHAGLASWVGAAGRSSGPARRGAGLSARGSGASRRTCTGRAS